MAKNNTHKHQTKKHLPPLARDLAQLTAHIDDLQAKVDYLIEQRKEICRMLGLLEEIDDQVNLLPLYKGNKESEHQPAK